MRSGCNFLTRNMFHLLCLILLLVLHQSSTVHARSTDKNAINNKTAGLSSVLHLLLHSSNSGKGLMDIPFTKTNIVEQISHATDIPTETFGPIPYATAIQGGPVYIPNGDSWNIYIPYASGYVAPGSLVTFNVDEKEPNVVYVGHKEDQNPVPYYDFRARLGQRRFIYQDKMVLPLQFRNDDTKGAVILTYDTASNRFTDKVQIPHDDFRMLVADANDEGIIRASGYTSNRSHYWFFEYHPHTKELTMSSKYPCNTGSFTDYSYGMTKVIGDWILMGMGKSPWELVTYNFKTDEWRKLKEIPGEGSHRTFYMWEQAVDDENPEEWVYIDMRDENDHSTYWKFVDGNLEPTTKLEENGKYTWNAHPLQTEYEYVGDPEKRLVWIDPKIKMADLTLPPPELDVETSIPNRYFKLNATYTWKGQQETAIFDVPSFKTEYAMTESFGDYLIGVAGEYGEQIFYNRTTEAIYPFYGKGLSAYSMNVIDDKVYISGYSNFVTWIYDQASLDKKNIGHFQKEVDAHRPIAGIEKGSDGNIYIGGQYNRNYKRGGLAIYNPVTEEKDGLMIDDYEPYWMAAIAEGRYMVMSCFNGNDDESLRRLLIYNVEDKELTSTRIDGFTPGIIVGVDTHIVGYGFTHEDNIIYRYDPIAKEFLWKIKVPIKPETGYSGVRRHHYARAYDGNQSAYFNIGNSLVKINVDDGTPTVLGELPSRRDLHITDDGEFFLAGGQGFTKLILP